MNIFLTVLQVIFMEYIMIKLNQQIVGFLLQIVEYIQEKQ